MPTLILPNPSVIRINVTTHREKLYPDGSSGEFLGDTRRTILVTGMAISFELGKLLSLALTETLHRFLGGFGRERIGCVCNVYTWRSLRLEVRQKFKQRLRRR